MSAASFVTWLILSAWIVFAAVWTIWHEPASANAPTDRSPE